MVAKLRGLSDNPVVILLLINVALPISGTFMAMSPLIVITTPIFLPVAAAFGIDPVHRWVIVIPNLVLGLCAPPTGAVPCVRCALGKITIRQAMPTKWPFCGAPLHRGGGADRLACPAP
ncbi:TRAP transporter large permease subunit [Paracoccaceae bacterium Fryx2]|nr:TRAP transporter large permease subunit [Paracoccaceae bacterium Fryx2]